MILVDLSQLMFANVFESMKTANDIDEDLARHMILNSIRKLKVKFSAQYGEFVICCDGGNFWRKQEFEHYKGRRKRDRDESKTINWKKIFGVMNVVKQELKENFPYRVVEAPSAEADDVIAVLASRGSIEGFNNQNPILIVSGDKDFIQLHKYGNVEQYDPINKRKIVHNDPYRYLKEHIIRGDVGDGIPNILSADNSLMAGIRQTPVTKKVIERFVTPENMVDGCATESERINLVRNTNLIDLSRIPDPIKAGILEAFDAEKGKGKGKLLGYFMSKKLSELFAHINEF